MTKPRWIAKQHAKVNHRPRRRSCITEREAGVVAGHIWFALTVWSRKERDVEKALRLMGYPSAFTSIDVRYRRGSRFRKAKDFERFNIATMPSYVFVGVPEAWGGLPWFHLRSAKEAATPGGMIHLTGYVADGEGRPAPISRASITHMMRQSMIPLYLTKEEEEKFDFDYGEAAPAEVLEPGEEALVAEGLLRGEQFKVLRVEGRDAVVEIGGKPWRIHAKHLKRAA